MGQEQEPRPTAAQLESVINMLPDVERSRVLLNEMGQIAEVHVLASDSRPAKHIVRDIESAVAVSCDLRLDHKVVSVAQLRGAVGGRGPDLQVHSYRMDLDPVNHAMTATVTLLVDGDAERPVVGIHEGSYIPSQQPAAVVHAAIAAVNQVVSSVQRVAFYDMRVVPLADRSAVVVGLTRLNARHHEDLAVGAAPDLGDAHAAAVGAVLQAYRQLQRPEPIR